MDIRSTLTVFALFLSINCFPQKIDASFLKGQWTGFDAKYERVSFLFIDGQKLQLSTASQKIIVSYSLKQVSKTTYLNLILPNAKNSQAFGIRLISKDSMAVEYPNSPSHGATTNFVILKRVAQARVSMVHWCMRLTDSTYEDGRALTFRNDSLVTRRTIKTNRHVDTEVQADTSNVDVTWLLPERDSLSTYRDSFAIANLSWYPWNSNKEKTIIPTLTYEKEGKAYLFFWDEAEDGSFMKSLDRFINYSKKYPAIKAKSYILEGKWGPVYY